jgi:malate dehydrogenase
LVYSFPVSVTTDRVDVVQGLAISEFSLERMRLTEQELKEERDAVRYLL